MKRLILTALLGLFWTSIVFAEDIKKYNFWWEQIPAVCSQSDEVQRWANDKNFIPVNMSVGREGDVPSYSAIFNSQSCLSP